MARSTKKKARHKVGSKKIWCIVLATVVAGLLASWVIVDQRNARIHQEELTAGLDQAGRALDSLAKDLRQSAIKGNVERSRYCYEASRKLEEGPTHCVQRLDVTQENASNQDIIYDFSALVNAMRNQAMFSFVTDEGLDNFDERGAIFADYRKTLGVDQVCRASFRARGDRWHAESTRNTYDVYAYCVGINFDESIYEFRTDSGPK